MNSTAANSPMRIRPPTTDTTIMAIRSPSERPPEGEPLPPCGLPGCGGGEVAGGGGGGDKLGGGKMVCCSGMVHIVKLLEMIWNVQDTGGCEESRPWAQKSLKDREVPAMV